MYNYPLEQQMVNVTLNVPILDWGRNKSYTKTDQANKELTDYTIAQEEVTFEQDVYTKVGQFKCSRYRSRSRRKQMKGHRNDPWLHKTDRWQD